MTISEINQLAAPPMAPVRIQPHEAKTRLSELVAAAERGDEVLIARNGTPAVRLVAVTHEHAPVRLGARRADRAWRRFR